jgi:hypothetical protein
MLHPLRQGLTAGCCAVLCWIRWPEMTTETSLRIEQALAKGGIATWELFEVPLVTLLHDKMRCCDA